MSVALADLNAATQHDFVRIVGGVFEHSPWIADRAWVFRPFPTIAALHERMREIVRHATADEQLLLIRAHPDLVGRLAQEGKLTSESSREQAAAGLSGLSFAEVKQFETHNAQYRERFGFPFIICARQNKREAILAAFPKRLKNTPQAEIETALGEIYKIANLRLHDAITE
ncbi:MAG TPA: 2-oxo-4-hydroxy-4-carboxy-5-ureidoimidazoline decarboxylase [Tepidisphaeraceae bacterium]|jgi:OHCU decarboxylase